MALILTVEDSITLRKLTTAILTRAGHTVVEARFAREALEKAAQIAADVVISDLYMPGMNGLELVKVLRQRPGYTTIPILLLTTETDPRKVEAAKKAGATGWLVKPLSAEKLLASLGQKPP